MKQGFLHAFPAALIWGFAAGAMAAPIHDAVRAGDVASVARLLKKHAMLVNLADKELGATPLYHAVDTGNPLMAKILLKAGAKVDVKTSDGMTPMLRAAAIVNSEALAGFLSHGLPPYSPYGPGSARTASREALITLQKSLAPGLVPGPADEAARLAVLRLLVEGGGSLLDTMDHTKCTPLHMAALIPNIKALEYLLGHGADPEAPAQGFRPLHLAVLWGNAPLVEILLAHKADVNAAQIPAVDPPLHVAVFSGNVKIIRLLLDHGAKVNALGRFGSPALHHATWNDETFSLLLERGADSTLQAADGTTTLHMACHDGSHALVAGLLRLQPEVDALDGAQFTPLLNAAEAGRVDLLKLLIAAGADLKAIDRNGRNALHLAAGTANPQAARFLLEKRFGVDEISLSGETALMNAAGHCRLEAVALLLDAGARVNGAEENKGLTALMIAALGGRVSPTDVRTGTQSLGNCGPFDDSRRITALLLDKGADIRAKDREGKTALNWACSIGNAGVAELLISRGAEVNAKDSLCERTPLHHAASTADAKTMALLLEKGAGITARDGNGCQPIHLATQAGNVEGLHLLLNHRAPVNVADALGNTPLHCAVISGKPGIVHALQEAGANPALRNAEGATPLEIATSRRLTEMINILSRPTTTPTPPPDR
jgi:ankyrin